MVRGRPGGLLQSSEGEADALQTYKYQPPALSARMSKITNDGLTQSGTECFVAVPVWQQWPSKG